MLRDIGQSFDLYIISAIKDYFIVSGSGDVKIQTIVSKKDFLYG
jgi:hypothetical protein